MGKEAERKEERERTFYRKSELAYNLLVLRLNLSWVSF